MPVISILKTKGRHIFTVDSGESLATITKSLAGKRIGAVVVTDASGAIAGIVSERDVVRALAEHGAAALKMSAADVMSSPVRTCTPEDTEAELMSLMTVHRIRHLPVLEEGRLAGMISIGDVVKFRMEGMQREAEDMRSYIETAG